MAKLLVVDDSVDVAHLIAEMLGREGHDVDVLHDGRQVVEKLKGGAVYDVIITDLIMPDLDGVGVMRYLNKVEDKTPVLVLSGGGVTISSDDALRAVVNMAAGVLAKPVKCDELLEKIESAMRSHD